MIGFLLKGLLRDRSRSLFPVLVVAAGVMLTVFMSAWVQGENHEFVRASAAFQTGHVKVTTRVYAEKADELPNDLALGGVSEMLAGLAERFPRFIWTPRIKFGGLLDIPDSLGETRSQGPVVGMAVDLLSDSSPEPGLLNLEPALIQGRMPNAPGEIIVSDDLARKLKVGPGDRATLFGSTMYGSMATANFTIAGTVRFGITALDKGAIIADVADVQSALDMTDAAGEIVGFSRSGEYDDRAARQTSREFNQRRDMTGMSDIPDRVPSQFDTGALVSRSEGLSPLSGESVTLPGLSGTGSLDHSTTGALSVDPYAPVMTALPDQGGLGQVLALHRFSLGIVIAVFMFAMSLVLWNAGLMGSLRRYGEFGVRLAIGERKAHLYRTLILESVMVGVLGTVLGTAIGLGVAYWLQATGLNFGAMLKGASVMVSQVLRPHVTATCYYIGLIPGLGATVIGAMISGATVFRRQTSTLIKELEL